VNRRELPNNLTTRIEVSPHANPENENGAKPHGKCARDDELDVWNRKNIQNRSARKGFKIGK